jgi:hypothetical protein
MRRSALLESPTPGSVPVWLRSLDKFLRQWFKTVCDPDAWGVAADAVAEVPALMEFVRQTLQQWHPAARSTAASASTCSCVRSLCQFLWELPEAQPEQAQFQKAFSMKTSWLTCRMGGLDGRMCGKQLRTEELHQSRRRASYEA